MTEDEVVGRHHRLNGHESMGLQRVRHDLVTKQQLYLYLIYI